MRRLLALSGFAAAALGLLGTPVDAGTITLPSGPYYGPLSGSLKPLPAAHCPVPPPSGTTGTNTTCQQLKGPFSVTAKSGRKLAGTYVANLATGDIDPNGAGSCYFTNAAFTFTVGKGNTFKAVVPTVPASEPDRLCAILLGPAVGPLEPAVLTMISELQITGGTGHFKGLSGTVIPYGTGVAVLTSTGHGTSTVRMTGNLGMLFGVA